MNNHNRNEAKRTASRTRRGASLLEGFMYLVLFGIVAAGSLYMYQSADTGRKTTAAASELGTIAAAVRNVYAGQSTYTILANLQIQGSLPQRMAGEAAGSIVHSFQGPIAVAPATPPSGNANSAFTVTFSNIPVEPCKTLATRDFGRAVVAMTINATRVGADENFSVATPAQSETMCNDANNVLAWTLY